MKDIDLDLCIEYQHCFFHDGFFSPFENVQDYRTFFPMAILGELGSLLNVYCKTFRSPNDYLSELSNESADVFVYLLLYGLIRENDLNERIVQGIADRWGLEPSGPKNDQVLCEHVETIASTVLNLRCLDNPSLERAAFLEIFIHLKAIHSYMCQERWQTTINQFHCENVLKFSNPMAYTCDLMYRGSCWVNFDGLLGFVENAKIPISQKRITFLKKMRRMQQTSLNLL